jgi:hypothetical protein
MVLGPVASELRAEYDKKKDNSKIDAITDDALKDITSQINPIFGQIDAYITYINNLGLFNNIDTFENTKISELEQSVTDLVTSINSYNTGGKNSTADNVNTVNARIQELADLITYISTSDKGRYWDKDLGGADPTNNTENALSSTSKTLAAVKLKAPPAAGAPTPTQRPATNPVPAAATPATAATSPGAVAFTIQGEIDKTSKKISKITSISFGDCKLTTPITMSDGKITENAKLTTEITNCITKPNTKGGGRKRRTTSKKRPRRKSYRRFQSRRRAAHAK